jgi:hypothetical protein
MKKLTINRHMLAQRTLAVVVAAALGMAMPVGGNANGASVVMSASAEPRRSYTPTAVYEGVFEPNRLYKVVHGSGSWGGSPRPSRVRDVTCRNARTALEHEGFWKGALISTGACGSGEPTEWATGNFLNFQAGLYEKDAAL